MFHPHFEVFIYAPESLLKVLVFRQLELPILSQACDTSSNTNPDAQKNTTTAGAPHPNLSQTCDTNSNTNSNTNTNTQTNTNTSGAPFPDL